MSFIVVAFTAHILTFALEDSLKTQGAEALSSLYLSAFWLRGESDSRQ